MFYSKKSYISFVVVASLWQASLCFAQRGPISSDSTYHLEGITVEGSAPLKVNTDQKIDSSLVVMDNAIGIGGLLKYNSLVYIKDYGPGNISSVSARGGSASQSQVIWNGININQAGLGMTDLSTLPPFLLDNITVQQSSSSATSGSGSMAGNVLLSNNATSNVGAYALLKQTISSIGEKSTGIRVGYNKNKWSSDVRYFYLNSDNTYRYAKPYEENQIQHDAGLLQQGYSATIGYQLSPATKLYVYSWYTHFDRNIAPTLTTITKVVQQDVSWRNSVQLSHQVKRSTWNYKLAYLRDKYEYTQRSASDDSVSRDRVINSDHGYTDNIVNQLEYTYVLSDNLTINAGFTQLYQSIINENLAQGGKSRNRVSLYGGVKWNGKRKRTTLTAQVREEFYATQQSPFIYALQLDQRVSKNIALLLKGERQYRIPTMNDLYWGLGGNPNLKPENGYGAEIGLAHDVKSHTVRNTLTINGFTRSIKDWILWTPRGEYNYWTPQNIGEVWSRGIEIKDDFMIQFAKQFSVTLSLKHTYQKTTQQDHSDVGGNAYHKQLIYTPVYLGNVGLVVQYKRFVVSYYHQYTSWVFIVNDESDFIDPYNYGILRVQAGLAAGKNQVDVYTEVDNCWNTNYQTVAGRPMPLRYARAGIIYKWN
jgi:vitamin B12 transporter